MFDIIEIVNLSGNDKVKLIDLIEGMPINLNKYVKMIINENYMTPLLFRSKNIILNKYASVTPYLNKNFIQYTEKPFASWYQSEYCEVCDVINCANIPTSVKSKLLLIMNTESYDISTMVALEVKISSILKECENTEYHKDLCGVISDIIYYKSKVFDFYSYLCLKDEIYDKHEESNILFTFNVIIKYILRQSLSYSYQSDLAIMIYVYFKYLGMEGSYDKYNLLNRFISELRHRGADDEYINNIERHICELSISNQEIGDVMDQLICADQYCDIGIIKKRIDSSCILNNNDRFMISDYSNYIFSSNDMEFFKDNIDDISDKMLRLNKDVIMQFVPDDFNKNHLSFELSVNDIGHIKNNKKMALATVYNPSTYEMQYICFYDNIYYILFNNRMKPNKIYGLSLDIVPLENNIGRSLLEIKESKEYYYKFISTI